MPPTQKDGTLRPHRKRAEFYIPVNTHQEHNENIQPPQARVQAVAEAMIEEARWIGGRQAAALRRMAYALQSGGPA